MAIINVQVVIEKHKHNEEKNQREKNQMKLPEVKNTISEKKILVYGINRNYASKKKRSVNLKT